MWMSVRPVEMSLAWVVPKEVSLAYLVQCPAMHRLDGGTITITITRYYYALALIIMPKRASMEVGKGAGTLPLSSPREARIRRNEAPGATRLRPFQFIWARLPPLGPLLEYIACYKVSVGKPALRRAWLRFKYPSLVLSRRRGPGGGYDFPA